MYDFVNLNFLPQIPIELLCLDARRPSILFMGAVNKKTELEHPVFRHAVLVYRLVLCEKGGHAAGAHAVLRLGGGGEAIAVKYHSPVTGVGKLGTEHRGRHRRDLMRRGLPYGSVSQAWMAFSSVIQPPFQDEFQKLLPHIPALQAISVALLFYQNPSIVDF